MLAGRFEAGEGAMRGKQRCLGTVNAPAIGTYLNQKSVGWPETCMSAQKPPVARE
jgi:hypothetical protein